MDWIKTVWKKFGGLSRKRSLLVWDSFRAHLSKPVKKRLKEINTHQAVIPGGLTSILQPLDVCINKPFKDYLRATWTKWMSHGDHQFTQTGRKKKASLELICQWILDACKKFQKRLLFIPFLNVA